MNPVYVKDLRVAFPEPFRETLDLGEMKVLVRGERAHPVDQRTLAQSFH